MNNKNKICLEILIILSALIGIMIPIGKEGQSHVQMISFSVVVLLACLIMMWSVNRVTNYGQLPLKRRKLSVYQLLIFILVFCIYLFVYVTGPLVGTQELFFLPVYSMIACVVAATEAGIIEEYLIRGYLFQLIFNRFKYSKYVLIISACLSSFIFGCLHFLNLVSGNDVIATFQQVFYTMCLGLFWAGIRIVFNRIYVGAILHTTFDMQSTIIDNGVASPWMPILILFGSMLFLSLLLVISYDRKNLVYNT
ncbi:hypothetical protein IV73_GL000579 [Weissella kandleri]|uniref:CAAX prenyl protease 2/Lysostaphin resistance protein A-like domain-containing protein n=1 Tax=Weissella kandleri TaxID=1616 RepID=A0A0R2JHS8_9LACO|nr:CPBP family intramembrane glutamic endopeptidase [Weissella kandleri]KRN75414.1 hypothetical protein IV73_GL000579 [Weissella kandleri]